MNRPQQPSREQRERAPDQLEDGRTVIHRAPISLPTFKFYGNEPVVYADGKLIIGGRVVRSRLGQ